MSEILFPTTDAIEALAKQYDDVLPDKASRIRAFTPISASEMCALYVITALQAELAEAREIMGDLLTVMDDVHLNHVKCQGPAYNSARSFLTRSESGE